jgi:glycosyltransferase involved in cell wall biosynthesis
MTVDSPRLPISVLIMTHRVDSLLTEVLQSVAWAAEIIIADYTSGTDWQDLKAQFGVQIVKGSKEKITDFGAARNRLLKEATQPWVLFLDSDEVVQPFPLTQLQVLIAQPQVAAATLRRIDIFHGQPLQHGEVGQVHVTRLARRAAIRFARPVHEVPEIEGQVIASELVIWHYAHDSVTEFLQSVAEYSRLEANSRPLPNVVQLWLEFWWWPLGKFLVNYGLKAGYKDGWRGLAYALLMSIHSLSVRAFLVERKQHDQRS